MAVQIIANELPDNFILVYGEARFFREDEHKIVFVKSLTQFLAVLDIIFSNQGELLIRSGYENLVSDEWFPIAKLLQNVNHFGEYIYMLDAISYITKFSVNGICYSVHIGSDPIYFQIEKDEEKLKLKERLFNNLRQFFNILFNKVD